MIREVPFTELLSVIVDNRGRTCPTAEDGIPLIATNCVKNEGLYPTYEKVRYVDEETYATWFRGHPEPGDILFVCKGSPGNVAMVPDPVDFCIAQDMVSVRADPARVYPKYLFAALRSPEVQRQIASMHVGTMIPHFKKGDFHQLQIPIVSPAIQRVTGDVYVALSKKIESNHRIVEVVDALARAELEVLTQSADSSCGVPVSDLVDRVHEPVTPGSVDPTTPYIGLEHVPRGQIVLDDWGVAGSTTSTKSVVRRGDLLFGKLRPYFRKVVISPIDGVCSTDILVLRPRRSELSGFALAVLASDEVIEYASSASAGTRMPRVSWDYLAAWSQSVPSTDRAMAMAESVNPMIDLAMRLVHESRSLAALRDALLPELLAGRLRVPEAEELVSDVT